MLPPIQLAGTRPAQAQVRFAATTNGSVTLGQESVPDVNAAYNVVLTGTQVAGAVHAGYNITASAKAKALSMKAGQEVKLDDADVVELVQGGTLISRNSRLGTVKGNTLDLNGTQVSGDVQGYYSVKASKSKVSGNVTNETNCGIVLNDTPVEKSVQGKGDVNLTASPVKAQVRGATLTATRSETGSIKAQTVKLTSSPVEGDVEAYYSIHAQDSEIKGGVKNSTNSSVTLINSPVGKDVTTLGDVNLASSPVTGQVSGATLTATGSELGSILAKTVKLTSSPVQGDVQAEYSIHAKDSKIDGSLSNSSSSSVTLIKSPIAKGVTVRGDLSLNHSPVLGAVVSNSGTVTAVHSGMGSVVSGSSIDLTSSPVDGNVQAAYSITARDSRIDGSVENDSTSTILLIESPVKGHLTTRGEVSLTDASVDGAVKSATLTATRSTLGSVEASSVTLNDAPVDGNVSATYNITARGSRIGGDLSNSSTSTIRLTDSPVSGKLETQGEVSLTGSSVTGAVISGTITAAKSGMKSLKASQATLTESPVTGNVEATYGIELQKSDVGGNVKNTSTSHIQVTDSEVGGTLETRGQVVLTRATMKGHVSANQVNADSCKEIQSLESRNAIDLKDSVVKGPVTILDGGTIHNTKILDTLTCKAGFDLSDVEIPEPWQLIGGTPLTIAGNSEVGGILVKKAELTPLNLSMGLPFKTFTPANSVKGKALSYLDKALAWIGLARAGKPEPAPEKTEEPAAVSPEAIDDIAKQQKQLIVIADNAVVNGNIEFEGGDGKIILHPGAKITGEVIGGELEPFSPEALS